MEIKCGICIYMQKYGLQILSYCRQVLISAVSYYFYIAGDRV